MIEERSSNVGVCVFLLAIYYNYALRQNTLQKLSHFLQLNLKLGDHAVSIMQFPAAAKHKKITKQFAETMIYAHNSLLSSFNKSTSELGTVIVVVVPADVAVASLLIPEAIVTFELVELMT
jgi:hypothetical protein